MQPVKLFKNLTGFVTSLKEDRQNQPVHEPLSIHNPQKHFAPWKGGMVQDTCIERGMVHNLFTCMCVCDLS